MESSKKCASVIYKWSFLDALREELENSERVANCEGEVKRLREILQLKESDVESLRRKTRLMEVNTEERFHEEKEKIVQILGEFLLFLVQSFLKSFSKSLMVQKLETARLMAADKPCPPLQPSLPKPLFTKVL